MSLTEQTLRNKWMVLFTAPVSEGQLVGRKGSHKFIIMVVVPYAPSIVSPESHLKYSTWSQLVKLSTVEF